MVAKVCAPADEPRVLSRSRYPVGCRFFPADVRRRPTQAGAARARRVEDAAAARIGTTVEDAALAALAKAASAACKPIDDKRGTIEFRTQVAGVIARRAATLALQRARAN